MLFLSSLRRLVLHTKYWPTPRRRSCMIAMESRAYEREVVEALAWMISSLTSLGEDCSASWGGRAEGDATGAGGEERIWCIPSSELAQGSWWNAQMAHFGVRSKNFEACSFGILTWFVICRRVSLEDLYNGKTTKLQLSKNVLCSSCNGWVLFDLNIYLN